MTEVRVNFGVLEDCRRVVFFELSELPSRQQSKLASAVTAALRDAGLLPGAVEQHYSASQAAALLARSPEYVVAQIVAGKLSPVHRDGGGWLIPASSLQHWLDDRMFADSSTPSIKRGVETGKVAREFIRKRERFGEVRAKDGSAGVRTGLADCADRVSGEKPVNDVEVKGVTGGGVAGDAVVRSGSGPDTR